MELAQLNEVEQLILESLHEFGPLELSTRSLPTIAASLGTNGKKLSLAKSKLLRSGFISEEDHGKGDSILHITKAGKALFSPEPAVAAKPAPVVTLAAKSEPVIVPMTTKPARAWWQFWKAG